MPIWVQTQGFLKLDLFKAFGIVSKIGSNYGIISPNQWSRDNSQISLGRSSNEIYSLSKVEV